MSNARIKHEIFGKLTKATAEGMDRAVRAIAFAIEEEAAHNIAAMGAIDTGALLNSRYVETSKDNGRPAAIARAARMVLKPGAKSGVPKGSLELATPSRPRRKSGEAKFAFAVKYAIYVNNGTSRMAGRPFMDQAVATIRREASKIAALAVEDSL